MEGDGPTGCLVIPEFYALKVHLASRVEELTLGDALLPMIRSMQTRVDKYFDEALQCNTTVMATLLNPFFRLQFFEQAFGLEHNTTSRARKLLHDKFDARKSKLALTAPPPPIQTPPEQVPKTSNMTGPGNLFQLFKPNDPKVEANEIAAYLKGTHPMSAKDDARKTKAVLPWWRVRTSFIQFLIEICICLVLINLTFTGSLCSLSHPRLTSQRLSESFCKLGDSGTDFFCGCRHLFFGQGPTGTPHNRILCGIPSLVASTGTSRAQV